MRPSTAGIGGTTRKPVKAKLPNASVSVLRLAPESADWLAAGRAQRLAQALALARAQPITFIRSAPGEGGTGPAKVGQAKHLRRPEIDDGMFK